MADSDGARVIHHEGDDDGLNVGTPRECARHAAQIEALNKSVHLRFDRVESEFKLELQQMESRLRGLILDNHREEMARLDRLERLILGAPRPEKPGNGAG